MENKDIFERISSNPEILHGKPCIKGTRVPVYMIVSLVGEGVSIDKIIKDYPFYSGLLKNLLTTGWLKHIILH